MAEETEITQEFKEETSEPVEHSEDYEKLIDYGINAKVAEELDEIYKSGILSHGDLDERALDALKEFPAEDGIGVLKEFQCSNLDHVSNKSAFLCGVMKTYRQKIKMAAQQAAAAAADPAGAKKPGPDEDKLKELLLRTGYTLDVTTGQRKYGGPPPGWGEQSQPGPGHEVFAGKIPKDMFEDELVPLFEKCGTIWDFRLMMEPLTGLNRGYAFVTFTTKDAAQEAVKQLDSYEIKPTRRLKVNVSVANVRLFVGNIPKSKSRDEIQEEFAKLTESLTDVIIYNVADDPKKRNRGFAFLEYDSHKSASVAKRKLGNGRQRVWNCDIIVDWADPQEEPGEETMSKVKVLYVRNLKQDVTEEQLRERFEAFGKVERVKKIKDYGFVHFEERDHALTAMQELQGQELGEGSDMEISLAKPPTENKKKEQRKREQAFRYDDFWGYPGRYMHGGRGGGGGGGRGRGNMHGRGGFNRGGDFYYDEMGYDGYHGGYADDFYGDYSDNCNDQADFGYGNGNTRGRGHGPPRGGRGGPPPPPVRGHGGAHKRGRGTGGAPVGTGMRGVGAPPASPGVRGARGAHRGMQGRGGSQRAAPNSVAGGSTRGNHPPQGTGGGLKRKAPMTAGAPGLEAKKPRNSSSTRDNWGAQPIAQQPLHQSGGFNDSQWYQDASYDQNWGMTL